MKKVLNKKILAATILLSFVPVSNATATGWPVSDIGLLAYLSNSAAGGVVTDNGGVISLLKQVESDLAQISAQNTSLTKSANDADNQRGKWALADNASLSRMPDSNACYAISAASSGGAASASSGSSKTSAETAAKDNVVSAVSAGPQSKNSRYERASDGFCSDDDAKYHRGGCTGAGQYPNGDIDAGGLDGAPLTSGELASNAVRRDYYTTDEASKARSLVENVTSNLPAEPITNKDYANSVNGLYYSTNLASYQAKALLAQKANLEQIAVKTEIEPGKLTGEQQTIWSDIASKWQGWFGFSNPKPTEWNLIKGQVYNRYANDKWLTKTSDMTVDESNREILRLLSLMSKMQLMQLQYQMTSNQLGSAQLGATIQPITYNQLQQIKKDVEQSGSK